MKRITLVPCGDLAEKRWSKGLWLYNVSVLFFFTLLRYNSHAIKFGTLKCTVHCFERNSHGCTPPLFIPEQSRPKRKLCNPWSSRLHSILHSLLPKAHGNHRCFLPLWVWCACGCVCTEKDKANAKCGKMLVTQSGWQVDRNTFCSSCNFPVSLKSFQNKIIKNYPPNENKLIWELTKQTKIISLKKQQKLCLDNKK